MVGMIEGKVMRNRIVVEMIEESSRYGVMNYLDGCMDGRERGCTDGRIVGCCEG